MRFLAFIGALAILVAVAAAIYLFGGFFSVAENVDNPAVVDWALASIRGASVAGHATDAPPANLDDPETVKAGAKVYSTIGCVNCHGGPPDANWAKWSEGLKPVPADLKVMAKERTAPQLFWVIRNGIKFTGMPSFGLAGASDQDIWSIVAFIRNLPKMSDEDYKSLDGVSLNRREPLASPQQVLEVRDQRRVGRRHRVAAQVLGPHPFQRLAVERLHEALPSAADIERHQQVEVVVSVAREGERREAGRLDHDAELFAELADQRLLRPFAGVDLAARKLPQALERLALRPLRQQHPAVRVDQRRRDDEDQPHAALRTGSGGASPRLILRSDAEHPPDRSPGARKIAQKVARLVAARLAASFETRLRRSSGRGSLTSDSRR